jgi:RIO kinase 1
MDVNDYDYEDGYDDMESELLGEASGGVNMKSSGGNLESKINLSNRAQNEIRSSEKKGEKRANYYGRDDRATSEQVMDPRTRMILFKLLNSKYLSEINGCLSTGKEANVYYAKGGNGQEYAVKIFKTSILVFKDRDR